VQQSLFRADNNISGNHKKLLTSCIRVSLEPIIISQVIIRNC